ncbi:MAG: transcription antitermination factor NusB [Lachnospiraceae bacterium]|nr:transcription antitermination factor NusB [Lachnospiraceae bacterium]
MTRRNLRIQIFKLLFRVEFNQLEEMPEQLTLFFEAEETIDEEAQAEIQAKYEAIEAKIPELDRMLNEKATGWTTTRMGKVDLAILRLALYEILYDDKVPASVAINEAVEIAKKFGQDESPSFINGILAKFVN